MCVYCYNWNKLSSKQTNCENFTNLNIFVDNVILCRSVAVLQWIHTSVIHSTTDLNSFCCSFCHLLTFFFLFLWYTPVVRCVCVCKNTSRTSTYRQYLPNVFRICYKVEIKNKVEQQLNNCLINRIEDGWNVVNYTL